MGYGRGECGAESKRRVLWGEVYYLAVSYAILANGLALFEHLPHVDKLANTAA